MQIIALDRRCEPRFNSIIDTPRFLVTAKDKAVLHTGDVRADKLFMQHLMREPVLQEYLVPLYSLSPDPSPTRRLNRIYIDTSQSWVLSPDAFD